MEMDCKDTEQIQTGSFLERFNSERSCKIKYNHIKYQNSIIAWKIQNIYFLRKIVKKTKNSVQKWMEWLSEEFRAFRITHDRP